MKTETLENSIDCLDDKYANEMIHLLTEKFKQELEQKVIKARDIGLKYVDTRTAFSSYAIIISEYFMIDLEIMLSTETRDVEYRLARQILWFICREGDSQLPASLKQLGDLSGGFDHATVRHGHRKVLDTLDSDKFAKKAVSEILDMFGYDLVKLSISYTSRRQSTTRKN